MSQPDDLSDRIDAGDEPIIDHPHPVTTNEVHGFILGLSTGFFLGFGGYPTIAGGMVAYASLDPLENDHAIGSMTVTHEPWWFAGSLLIGYGFGVAVRSLR